MENKFQISARRIFFLGKVVKFYVQLTVCICYNIVGIGYYIFFRCI